MKNKILAIAGGFILALSIAGCSTTEQAETPDPIALTAESCLPEVIRLLSLTYDGDPADLETELLAELEVFGITLEEYCEEIQAAFDYFDEMGIDRDVMFSDITWDEQGDGTEEELPLTDEYAPEDILLEDYEIETQVDTEEEPGD